MAILAQGQLVEAQRKALCNIGRQTGQEQALGTIAGMPLARLQYRGWWLENGDWEVEEPARCNMSLRA